MMSALVVLSSLLSLAGGWAQPYRETRQHGHRMGAGSTDVTLRLSARPAKSGQPIVIQNKPGGGRPWPSLKNEKPDGYTWKSILRES
jgi:hypothetical protein